MRKKDALIPFNAEFAVMRVEIMRSNKTGVSKTGKKRLIALLLSLLFVLSFIFTGCSRDVDGATEYPDGGKTVGKETEIKPPPDEDDGGDKGGEKPPPDEEIELPPKNDDEGCPCGCDEDTPCECDHICLDPSHLLTYDPSDPVITFTGLRAVTVAAATGEEFKDAILSGVYADDGKGNDITDDVIIKSVDGVAVTDAFNWDGLSQSFGTVRVLLSVTNIYGRVYEANRNVTVADVPKITLNTKNSEFNFGSKGQLLIYEGEKLTRSDIVSMVSVSDRYDTGISSEYIEVLWNNFNAASAGDYSVTVIAENIQGIEGRLDIAVEVLARANPFRLIGGESSNFVMTATFGSEILAAAKNGVTAVDPVYGEIPSLSIIPFAVTFGGKTTYDGLFNFSSLDDKTGVVAITFKIRASDFTDDLETRAFLSKFSFTREITLIEAPDITVKESAKTAVSGVYEWGTLIDGTEGFKAIGNDGFSLIELIEVSGSDFDIGDLKQSGTVNFSVAGLYEIEFYIETAHGLSSSLTVKVYVEPYNDDLTIGESPNFSVLKGSIGAEELKNRLMSGLTYSYDGLPLNHMLKIEALYKDGRLITSASGNYDFDALLSSVGVITVVIGTDDQAAPGTFLGVTRTVTVAAPPEIIFDGSVYGDNLVSDKTIEVYKNQELDYMLGISAFDELQTSLSKRNITVTVKNGGGEEVPFSTEMLNTFYITFSLTNRYGYSAETLTLTVKVVARPPEFRLVNGYKQDITVAVTDESGFKAKVLEGLKAFDGDGNDITGQIAVYSVDGKLDGSFNYGDVLRPNTDIFVRLWVSSAEGTIGYYERIVRLASFAPQAFEAKRGEFSATHTHTDEGEDGTQKPKRERYIYDDNGNMYCGFCGCCTECIVCFPRDEYGNIIGTGPKPVPSIEVNEDLMFVTGRSETEFKRALLTGLTVDDGFGADGISLVQFYAIDGEKVKSGFDWKPYLSAPGEHTITYYIVNSANEYILLDRTFTLASAPVIELDYGDFYETLNTEINGNSVPVTHIVVIIGKPFDPLNYASASDPEDASVGRNSILMDGVVNTEVAGTYKVSYYAKNSKGLESSKKSMYFNVRNHYVSDFSNGLDAYAEIQRIMAKTDFTSVTKGGGEAAGNDMVIYSTRQKKGDETFFENLSNGGKPWGVNADFARRVYRNGDAYRYSHAEGGFGSSNGVVTGAKWSNGENWSKSDFETKFGRGINDLTNYLITPTSVKNPGNGIGDNKNGTYSLSYELKIDKGNKSEGVVGYAKQIPTMSGGKACTNFFGCTINIKFDSNFRLLEVKTFESYEVDSGTIAGKVDMKATLIDYYEYPSVVTVTKF